MNCMHRKALGEQLDADRDRSLVQPQPEQPPQQFGRQRGAGNVQSRRKLMALQGVSGSNLLPLTQ